MHWERNKYKLVRLVKVTKVRGSAQGHASHQSPNSSLGPGLDRTLGKQEIQGDGCTLSRSQGRLPKGGEPALGLRSEEKQWRMGSEGIRLRCSLDAWEARADVTKVW